MPLKMATYIAARSLVTKKDEKKNSGRGGSLSLQHLPPEGATIQAKSIAHQSIIITVLYVLLDETNGRPRTAF